MTPQQYRALRAWLDAHPAAKRAVIDGNRWLPAVPFVCYPLLLILLAAGWASAPGQAALWRLAKAVLVPGAVFCGGTVLRAALDWPRPYEQPGFTPLVTKATRGKSFPSRHALSAGVLAAAWLYDFPAVGAIMCAVTVCICVLRVLGGVHFVRDVAAGAVLGFALGWAGMCLL